MNSIQYQKELYRLVRTKQLIKLLPKRLRLRVARFLYNYTSDDVSGIDISVKTRHDIDCLINTKDLIGWNLFFFGEYESRTNDILEKYVKEGDCVFEAGANIGTETLLLSKYVGSGNVYAFEPSPNVFERLSYNVTMNAVSNNIIISDVALGESDKEITFYVFPKVYHNSGLSGKNVDWKDAIPIQVQQMTMDSWVEKYNIEKVDFIKMDVQGAEPDILQGAAGVIDKHKPKVFMEAHENLEFMFNFLYGRGYRIYLLCDGMQEIKECPTVKCNWLAIHEADKA